MSLIILFSIALILSYIVLTISLNHELEKNTSYYFSDDKLSRNLQKKTHPRSRSSSDTTNGYQKHTNVIDQNKMEPLKIVKPIVKQNQYRKSNVIAPSLPVRPGIKSEQSQLKAKLPNFESKSIHGNAVIVPSLPVKSERSEQRPEQKAKLPKIEPKSIPGNSVIAPSFPIKSEQPQQNTKLFKIEPKRNPRNSGSFSRFNGNVKSYSDNNYVPEKKDRVVPPKLNILNYNAEKEQQFLYQNINGMKTIDTKFWPDYMKGIKSCSIKETNSMNIRQASTGILFVLIVTPDYLSQFNSETQSLRLYCDIHGYNLQIVDPNPILHNLYTNKTQYSMTLAPSVMRVIFQDLYRVKGCDTKWLVILDVDIFVIDYKRKIEAFIHNANHHSGQNRECKIIAQDSLTSLNTGFLFFSMTDFSYNWLNYWVIVLRRHSEENWLFAQGYFQYIYLEYIQTMSEVYLPFDCAQKVDKNNRFGLFDINFQSLLAMRGKDNNFTHLYASNLNIHCSCNEPTKCLLIGKNGLKNICYVKALQYLGLEYNINSSRSYGNICLLPGLTTKDRFNIHDFGRTVWDDDKKMFGWSISNDCALKGQLFYHGKDRTLFPQLIENYKCAYFRKHRVMTVSTKNITVLNCSYFAKKNFQDPDGCDKSLVKLFQQALSF